MGLFVVGYTTYYVVGRRQENLTINEKWSFGGKLWTAITTLLRDLNDRPSEYSTWSTIIRGKAHLYITATRDISLVHSYVRIQARLMILICEYFRMSFWFWRWRRRDGYREYHTKRPHPVPFPKYKDKGKLW